MSPTPCFARYRESGRTWRKTWGGLFRFDWLIDLIDWRCGLVLCNCICAYQKPNQISVYTNGTMCYDSYSVHREFWMLHIYYKAIFVTDIRHSTYSDVINLHSISPLLQRYLQLLSDLIYGCAVMRYCYTHIRQFMEVFFSLWSFRLTPLFALLRYYVRFSPRPSDR